MASESPHWLINLGALSPETNQHMGASELWSVFAVVQVVLHMAVAQSVVRRGGADYRDGQRKKISNLQS